MARYNAIQIGSIYLTRTGLSDGTPCKTSVSGLSALKPAKKKHVIKAIDGTPFSQFFTSGKGIDIEVTIDWLAKSVFDSLNTAMDAIDSTQTPATMVVTGDGGTFTLSIVPGDDYVVFDQFSNGIFHIVKYRVVTT